MKKFLHVFCVVSLVAMFSACSSEKVDPSYVKFDAKSYDLTTGFIADYGTNDALTYRQYEIMLQNKETNPSVYINFNVYSLKTSGLEVGTYTYSYSSLGPGKFSYLYMGKDLVWDSKNVITSGIKYKESSTNIGDGSKIVITKNDDGNFVFDLDIKYIDENDNTIAITGQFSKVLTESSYIYSY